MDDRQVIPTWDDILRIGLGECSLMPEQLYSLELRELLLMREGRNSSMESVVRELWEAVRFNTFCLLNVQLDKAHRLKSAEQLIRFPWDREQKNKQTREPTPEEWDAIWTRFPDKDT